MKRIRCYGWVALLLTLLLAWPARATAEAPSALAERLRTALFNAQLFIDAAPDTARAALETARDTYRHGLQPTLSVAAPEVDTRIQAAFTAADQALATAAASDLAVARMQIWAGVLAGATQVVDQAIQRGDLTTARQWLAVREFRVATRFARPDADATRALEQLSQGAIAPDGARQAVRADLLDTYQARLDEALRQVAQLQSNGFRQRLAEQAAAAAGYFAILAPAYNEQRGQEALRQTQRAVDDLVDAAAQGHPIDAELQRIHDALRGFRAAPLSPAEQTRRAGQLLRFLALVPIEYGRGVKDGVITRDLEIREAITFHAGAMAAFSDLQPLLSARDESRATRIAALLGELDARLTDAGQQRSVAAPQTIQSLADRVLAELRAAMPPEWQQQNSAADFDVITAALDQMEQRVSENQYELAESARLEAYAVLESGPEARLIAFAPQTVQPIEDLFWYGQGAHPGLAWLLEHRASIEQVRATRTALDAELATAQQLISGNAAPTAVATNAAIIVFREGLEAVLILASLMGSLKMGEQRRYRRPIWAGAAIALLASALTWLLMRGLLLQFARYGERLEAIVSLIAIGVLLLITNWFFHNVYWTGWMATFHARKRRILSGHAGLILGLIMLGFTSIYREGFETVLFLQALVLEAGSGVVLSGVGLGLAATALIGLLVFVVQAKLPHKKMLIVTGVLIGAVLLVMVGNTVHVMQVVGWLPTHPLAGLQFPYWWGWWFGVFPTWEGVSLQLLAGAFVIGSYFAAEHVRHRGGRALRGQSAPRGA